MKSNESASHLHLGAIIFPQIDQTDFTGPFEILSRVPDSTFHILWKEKGPVRDIRGLMLTPEETFAEVPQLDVLLVPGGPGQQALMEDETVLSFIRKQAETAKYVFSVCTGALVCGAAGLLKGRQATTHWASVQLLPYFGAVPVDQRVVKDGNIVTTAGVTAGLDGALVIAALLRGDDAAKEIQLGIEYAPEPPFQSGTPATAPPEVVEAFKNFTSKLTEARLITARRVADRLGICVP
ncbi:MAG TPA: DJ-1/PfpI family protein [Candidatus Angelobacter sp.]